MFQRSVLIQIGCNADRLRAVCGFLSSGCRTGSVSLQMLEACSLGGDLESTVATQNHGTTV